MMNTKLKNSEQERSEGDNKMKKFMTKGILISSVVLFSIILIVVPSNVYAENIDIKSFSLEETVILQVTNNSNENIDTFRIWLGDDFNFKSFKTENGWIGEKTPQGVIVFKSSKSWIPGETVKFGIKTDKISSGINWKALNKKGEQLDIGKVLLQEIPKVTTNPTTNLTTNPTTNQSIKNGIRTESIFKIIPENPNVGSTIRVTGENFGAHHEFDFYIDMKKIGNFTTDNRGHFITTMNIPDETKSGRNDFKIKNVSGEEIGISIRIGESNNRVLVDNVKLTIQGIPNYSHRGDTMNVFGTAQPGTIVTMKVINPNSEVINIRNIEVSNTGDWELEKPITIPLDAIFGKYNITILNENNNVLKNWIVESDKNINIIGTNLIFEPGEKIKIQGTGIPNEMIEIIIEDPIHKEIVIENLQIDDSGVIEFEHQTKLSYLKGTYKITLSQGKDNERIFVGLGQLPIIPIGIEFDKTNYNSGEIAIIELTGNALEIVNMLIIDPTAMIKGELIPITLQSDGKAIHQLKLENYNSGIYTAQISKGNSQNSKQFAVGLQIGSGEINLNTTKTSYSPGESILILGETGKNVILIISLSDPDGKIIKENEIFSDKDGIISNDSFRIPNDAIEGKWKIKGKSGSNFTEIDFQVLNKEKQGMVITIEKGIEIATVGKTITIKITGVQQTVQIEIVNDEKEVVEKFTLKASTNGEVNLPWLIPKNIEGGIYTVVAEDSINSIQSDFKIE